MRGIGGGIGTGECIRSAQRAASGRMFLVVSLGHSGTQWLTNLLNSPGKGSVCFSELKSRIYETVTACGRPPGPDHIDRWAVNRIEIDHPHMVRSMHRRYFDFMARSGLMFDACGDVNSWTPAVAPFACRALPVETVVLLFRNGVSVVNSLFLTLCSLPHDHYVLTRYGADAARLMGRELPPSFGSPFEQVCMQWLQNDWFPGHFAQVLDGSPRPGLLRIRFEDLVSPESTEALSNLCNTLVGPGRFEAEYLAAMQSQVINRHQSTSDPQAIWQSWSPAQRGAFTAICGDAMQALGYSLPAA